MDSNTWIKITDIILYASIAIVGLFAVLGLAQWISRKSIKKVDKQILWMVLPLALVVIVYLVCDKILTPDRFSFMPTRPDGSGEPSFPSTHVLVVTTVFFCISAALPKYIKSKVALFLIDIVMFALASLVATGRIMSDKHSYIDVAGSVVFALIFYGIYNAIIHRKKAKKEEPKDE